MTGTEIIAVIGCVALGYWIVAVFIPSILETDAFLDEAQSADPLPDPDARADHGAADAAQADVDQRASDDWFRVLGIPESSCRADIVAAYKRKIRQYHPDLVTQLGPELRELAERKSKQINAAYDRALKLRSATCRAG